MSADKSFHCWVKVFVAEDAATNDSPAPADTAESMPLEAEAADESFEQRIGDPSTAGERADIDGTLFRIRPPRGRRFAMSALAVDLAEDEVSDRLDVMRIRPPRGLPLPPRMSQLLRTGTLDQQPYRLGGYAMAGWWNLPVVYGGQLGNGFLDVAFHPVPGAVNDAAEWIESASGKAWRDGAHSWFLMEFRAESSD